MQTVRVLFLDDLGASSHFCLPRRRTRRGRARAAVAARVRAKRRVMRSTLVIRRTGADTEPRRCSSRFRQALEGRQRTGGLRRRWRTSSPSSNRRQGGGGMSHDENRSRAVGRDVVGGRSSRAAVTYAGTGRLGSTEAYVRPTSPRETRSPHAFRQVGSGHSGHTARGRGGDRRDHAVVLREDVHRSSRADPRPVQPGQPGTR